MIKKKLRASKTINVVLLLVLVVSFFEPVISRAQVDDFPLPETFVDFPSPEELASTNGTDGVEGNAGTEGQPGAPTDSAGTDGDDGLDSPASYVDDDPDNVGANGSSTSSGQPGTNGDDASSQPAPGQGADGMSGNNIYRGRAANVFIKTGNASAYASIINYINTTVIGSRNLDIINIYGPAVGTLDFSDFNVSNSVPDSSSSLANTGNSTPAILDVTNDGSLSNNLNLDASSGSNRIEGANGNVVIETGDVEVDASVFNMVNTNLIGHGWRFKVINIFSDLVGDLILPTLESQKSSAGCSGCLQSLNVTNGNTASVGNTINVNANSGNNSASSNGGSTTIETGNVNADASVYNLVDTTIIGDDWYYTQFHVAGDWRGSVYNTNSTVDFLTSGRNLAVQGGNGVFQPSNASSDRSTATTSNNASVQNNITINADSGNNTAGSNYGDAAIKTGDVRAKTAVTNVVNTTIIGDGWQFYLVNIFGNWKGSAHYGMPDLAVSEVAVPDATPARRGNTITYVYSYTNGGDATATDVVLRDRFDADKVHVTDTSGGVVRGNTITWRIGRLKPRETRVLSYTTTVNAPDGSLPIQNEVTIAGGNGDRDVTNNSTGGRVSIAGLTSGGGGSSSGSGGGGSYYYGSSGSGANPEFNLVKSSERETYRPGETMPFSIVLDNFKPVSGYEVGVVDQFIGPENNVVMTKAWDLGEVVGFEHIEIAYTIPIPTTAAAGPYSNQVTVYSKNSQGHILPTVVASLPITIAGEPVINESAQSAETPPFDLEAVPTFEGGGFLFPTTTASTTSFLPTKGNIKRSVGSEVSDSPIIYGYSTASLAAFAHPSEKPPTRGIPFALMNLLKLNFYLSLLLSLFIVLAYIVFRYTKGFQEWLWSKMRWLERVRRFSFMMLLLTIVELILSSMNRYSKTLLVQTKTIKKNTARARVASRRSGLAPKRVTV